MPKADNYSLDIDGDEAELNPTIGSVQLTRWQKEAKFSFNFLDSLLASGDATLIDGVLIWDNVFATVKFYGIESALEYEIVLKKKIIKTQFNLAFTANNLVLLYQPPLTEEYQESECEVWTDTYVKLLDGREFWRPQKVCGSYAVYHTSKRGNQYKTGKAFHIYRPHIVDADGNEYWGTFNSDAQQTGILTVYLPDLKKATYPVVIDPTFGYTSQGASNSGVGSAGLLGLIATLGVAGDVTKISAYCVSSGNEKAAIYDTSGGDPNNLEGGTGETNVGAAAWYDFTYGAPLGLVAADYSIQLFLRDSGSKLYYDAGGASGDYCIVAYNGFPDPYPSPNASDNRWSIYATYTAAGGLSESVTDTLTLADQKILKSQKLSSDIIAVSSQNLGVFHKVLSQQLSTVDSKVVSYIKNFTETLTNSDSTYRQLLGALSETITDYLVIADTVTRNFWKQLTDTITNAPSTSQQLISVLSQSITDFLSFVDSTVKNGIKTVSEQIANSDSTLFKLTKQVTDNLTVASSTSQLSKLIQTITDALTFLDSTTRNFIKQYTDTLTVSYLTSKTFDRTVSDTITVTSQELGKTVISIIESLNISEEQKRNIIKVVSQAITFATQTSFLPYGFVYNGLKIALTLAKRSVDFTIQKMKIILRLEEAE